MSGSKVCLAPQTFVSVGYSGGMTPHMMVASCVCVAPVWSHRSPKIGSGHQAELNAVHLSWLSDFRRRDYQWGWLPECRHRWDRLGDGHHRLSRSEMPVSDMVFRANQRACQRPASDCAQQNQWRRNQMIGRNRGVGVGNKRCHDLDEAGASERAAYHNGDGQSM